MSLVCEAAARPPVSGIQRLGPGAVSPRTYAAGCPSRTDTDQKLLTHPAAQTSGLDLLQSKC
jgi:hypothetical protein